MIDRRTVFEIHRLFHESCGIRKIARTLQVSRDSVKRYLDQPNPPKPVIVRDSKCTPSGRRSNDYWKRIPRSAVRSHTNA
jgi:hypothetical protein